MKKENDIKYFTILISKLYTIIMFSIFFLGPMFIDLDYYIEYQNFYEGVYSIWKYTEFVHNFFVFVYMWMMFGIPLLIFSKLKYNRWA